MPNPVTARYKVCVCVWSMWCLFNDRLYLHGEVLGWRSDKFTFTL